MHPDCSCTGRLEADLSRSGMAFRSPKSQVFLYLCTELCCDSRLENMTREMRSFSPDASPTGHISLSCRLSVPEYRSSNDRLGKDSLFGYTCAVQCSAKDLELDGAEQTSFRSSIPESLQSSSQANTITVLSYSKL